MRAQPTRPRRARHECEYPFLQFITREPIVFYAALDPTAFEHRNDWCLSSPVRQNSGSQTPRVRPHATTLSIPGMTRSRVSPDGKIAERDVAAKLVIIMVGLPARGKSYITKKIQRYLSWQQHDTRIFNVGNRRRIAAGQKPPKAPTASDDTKSVDGRLQAATVLLNGVTQPDVDEPTALDLNDTNDEKTVHLQNEPTTGNLSEGQDVNNFDQSAKFFDPTNATAAQLREKVAMDTLDELLDYLINSSGAVGILDATNSTIARREVLVKKIREREPKLGILFIESICQDRNVSPSGFGSGPIQD